MCLLQRALAAEVCIHSEYRAVPSLFYVSVVLAVMRRIKFRGAGVVMSWVEGKGYPTWLERVLMKHRGQGGGRARIGGDDYY